MSMVKSYETHLQSMSFYLALSFIVVGVGFLKPNISTIVGKLYPDNDPRRDSGFTIFYQGINIGSFVATVLCVWLGETYGWGYGFGAAGLGMLVGLVTFIWGQKYLYGHAEPTHPERLKEPAIGPINKEWAIYIGSFLSLGVVWFLVQKIAIVFFTQNLLLLISITGLIYFSIYFKNKSDSKNISLAFVVVLLAVGLLSVFGFTVYEFPESVFGSVPFFNDLASKIDIIGYVVLALVSGFIIHGFMKSKTDEYSRMIVLIILIMSTIVFWALFEQSASSMTLFADRVIDRNIISTHLVASDAWKFYLICVAFFVVSGFSFLSARKYCGQQSSGFKPIMLPSSIVLAAFAVLGFSAYLYLNGSVWIANFSYLGIFILLLLSVTVAIALAFIFIGFFYQKSNQIHQNDAVGSASSLSIVATTLLILGAAVLYFAISKVQPLSNGETYHLNWTATAGQFGSLNAMFIILLAPVFATLWVKLEKSNKNPSTPVKFSLGLIQVGLGFGALLVGALMPAETGKVAWIWLMLAYLLHTTGELCLSPVGLSAVTKLSIKSVVGLVMGVWFLATSLSEVVAVLLAKIAALNEEELLTLTITEQLGKYNELWGKLIMLGVVFGVILLVISPFLKRGMKGIK